MSAARIATSKVMVVLDDAKKPEIGTDGKKPLWVFYNRKL